MSKLEKLLDDSLKASSVLLEYLEEEKPSNVSDNIKDKCEELNECIRSSCSLLECDSFSYVNKDGEKCYLEEEIIAFFLQEEILFVNSMGYLYPNRDDIQLATLVCFVNCSDLFYWGLADAENIELSEVGDLWEWYLAEGGIGVSKWCCLKRGMRPQYPVEKSWREQGSWCEKMESLPER